MHRGRTLCLAAILALSAPWAAPAAAQETHLFKDAPTASEYATILFADPAQGVPLTRGIVFKPEAGAPPAAPSPFASHNPNPALASASAGASAGANAAPAKVGVLINFEFNSDTIPDAYHAHLDNLAQALATPEAKGRGLKILGHTDTTGGDAYNEGLSTRRAQSVRNYLVAHGVAASRLTVVGLGERDPLPGLDGKAAENRRVEFQAV